MSTHRSNPARGAVGACVVLVGALLLWTLTRIDWSAKVPLSDWIATFATAGALVVTAILLVSEMAEARRRRAEEERAEAKLVAAWLLRPDHEDPGVTVVVRNRCSEPIYDVRAVAEGMDDSDLPHPGARKGYMARILPPGEDGSATFESYAEHGPEVSLEFTDAAGRNWRRATNGALTEGPVERDLAPCWNDENFWELEAEW